MAKTLIGNVKGPKGDKGDKGATGATGPAGATGAQGPKGDTGAAFTYDMFTAAQLAALKGPTGATGPKGDKGDTGPQGPQGPTGEVGPQGPTGHQGPAGADGAAATIEKVTAEVDGSYLTQPTVTVTPGGTPSNRSFHFAFKGLRGLSGGGEGGGGTTVQADMSVNDPNDPSYVKERTHWKEVFDGPEGEIIPETSLAFNGNFNFGQLSGMSAGVQIGGYYIVTHNGKDYECVGRDSGDGAYIGNGSLLGYGNLANTGEPFCILAFGGTVYYLYKADKTAETITVKVVGKKETVWHKLEGGYLPEGVPYSEGVKLTELYSALVEIDPDSGAYEGVADVPLTVGETYTVTYNGVDYSCVCSTMDMDGMTAYVLGNLGAMTGGADTGEPFIILTIPAMGIFGMYALDGSASVTLSISAQVETVHKMDGKFLPKGTPYIEPFDDVILEETVLADVAVEGAAKWNDFYNFPLGSIVVGNIYEVVLDGVPYQAKAYAYTGGNNMLSIVLGSGVVNNGSGSSVTFPGAPYSNLPFGIAILSPSEAAMYGFTVQGAWANGAPERISIRGAYKVNKMEMDCLPNFPVPMVVDIVNDGGTYIANVEKDAVVCAVKIGQIVFARVKESNMLDSFDFYPLLSCSSGDFLTFGAFAERTYTMFEWSDANITKRLIVFATT